MNKYKCFYCSENYIKNTEHVFPDGLGGQNIYMSCVCEKCNHDFSKLEGELYRKGIANLMRSVAGISSKKKHSRNYFKAQTLLSFDELNKIVYEVNQYDDFKIELKPQIIEIGLKFHIEGTLKEDIYQLTDKVKKWKKNNLKMILKFPEKDDDCTSYVQFQIKENLISSETLKSSSRINKAVILDVLDSHELSPYLKPRIFLDNEKNLIIRAISVVDAVRFLKKFLIFTSRPVNINSYSKIVNDNGIVYVGFNFDLLKAERAMAKIILNCLLHYFPNSINFNFDKFKSFVKNGETHVIGEIERKDDLIDSLEDTHNIFFHQYGDNLKVRLSLFNGGVCYSFIMEDVNILDNMDYKRLIIDFKKKENKIQDKNAFLMSFNK
ncbi:hypothetical protein DVK85_08020 [Flavobacterium arcticum]|uniref:Uncharacterized protein n=1 Tax=Flavobacterium arcticum TaxID=1784713 RepID=A0A345HC77_9FLAO|nr:HNH endonuclease [Flavobacterium arcticum]AXG74187.1 hypothetical protein DVK85_08020 [Flavobacterium arcticum]KAF2508225.1 HNH endonuclease [Flavobacterium arcticum]